MKDLFSDLISQFFSLFCVYSCLLLHGVHTYRKEANVLISTYSRPSPLSSCPNSRGFHPSQESQLRKPRIMDLSEQWKSQFPIGIVPNAPLLCSSSSRGDYKTLLGPLCFNPKPHNEAQLLFASPALCPPILSPYPRLCLPRFLSTSTSIAPSTCSSVVAQIGTQNLQDDGLSVFSQNRLQILPCPGNRSGLVFFPTGCNHDQVGFLLLSVGNSTLSVKGSGNGDILSAKERLCSRIVRILVSPVDDFAVSGFSGETAVTIGLLMAYTLYTVHWYGVIYSESWEKPFLKYLGCKQFKRSIVGGCWSPHIEEECLVLLEDGVLFLFDMTNEHFQGTRLNVMWDKQDGSEKHKWLGVEFSWHPRIFLVARSDKVFLLDLRFGESKVRCLAKVDTLTGYTSVEKDEFIAFSRAGADGFQFVVASYSLLFICDVREEFRPLLHWSHGVDKPSYVNVHRLSEMRSSGSRVTKHDWATESGFCIILGSFWNSQFAIFCYGPSPLAKEGQNMSDVSKSSMSLYAWELPSNFLVSARECPCGDCTLREEVSKEFLPEWIDWQQKKETVLGFCILDAYFPDIQSHSDDFSGFVLIRLMSSGKLEAQTFCASWELIKVLEGPHTDSVRRFNHDNLLYLMDDGEYKFTRKFKYLKLNYLRAYLGGKLSEALELKNGKPLFDPEQKTKSFSLELHETLCQKLRISGFNRDRSAPAVSVVFNDVTTPSSIFEIALRQTWAGIPTELLMLAFSNYSELIDVQSDKKNVSLEFLEVPERPQLPPFLPRNPSCRSNKWSHKVQPGDSLVGPALPLPVLLTLHEFHNGCPSSQEDPFGFSADSEISNKCAEVSKVSKEMTNSGENCEADENFSLGDDRDEMWVGSQKPKPFISYQPCITKGESSYEDQTHSTLISKVNTKESTSNNNVKKSGLEMFDDLSPIDLKFDDREVSFGSNAASTFNMFKKQFSLWQDRFTPYQEFVTQYNLKK